MKKTSSSKLVLRQRDYSILRLLYEHRFLSCELLWHSLRSDTHVSLVNYSIGIDGKSRPRTYNFKRQALSKRLKQLYDAGYVERHYVTDQPLGRGYGSPRAVYGLGSQCPRVLQETAGIPIKEIKRIIERNKVKSPFLRHALELATFKIILELACQKSIGKVKLLFWEQGDCLKDYVYGVNDKRERERFTVYADAFFGLEIRDKGKRHFFLEIDRGTEPIVSKSRRSNIRRKLIGYQYYRKSKRTTSHYSSKISGFQVLIVTPGYIKSDKTIKGRVAHILNELSSNPNMYTSRSLFLLTTPASISLENPQSILTKIWISRKSNKSLLSLIEQKITPAPFIW